MTQHQLHHHDPHCHEPADTDEQNSISGQAEDETASRELLQDELERTLFERAR